MKINVIKTSLEEIKSLRILFLHENNFQFVYDKCHYYGWADTYLILADGKKVGYGAVWGKEKREDRDCIMEFFITKTFRKYSNEFFDEFLSVSGTAYIECQSNDHLLTDMLYSYAANIHAEAILFEDHFQTNFELPDVEFGKRETDDKNPNNVGEFFLSQGGVIVATGGFMLNYNIPYADIYMDVIEGQRRKGFGCLLIQELKKEIYLMARVPAARCNINNRASKACLMKAGLQICGYRINGIIRKGQT